MNYKTLHIDSEKSWRGGQRQVLYLACGLRENGCSAAIACPPDSVLMKKGMAQGLEMFPVKMRGEWDISASIKLTNIIKQKKIQIAHFHSGRAHTLGWLACINNNEVKKVLSRRTEFHIRNNFLSKKKHNQMDKIIAISNGVKNILIADGISTDKIAVVYSGIEQNKQIDHAYQCNYDELPLNKGNKVVATVGALTKEKGHEYFLLACAEVKKKFPSVQFLIIGEGKLKNYLVSLSTKLGISEDVIFTGFRNDVAQLLSLADIFVLPSQKEGLGTSLFEAMALRLPIVASKTGGIPEVVKEGINGILVPYGDVHCMSESILKFLNDDLLAKKYGEAGEKILREQFDIKRTVEETQKIYIELMKN